MILLDIDLPGLPPTVNHLYRSRGKIRYKTAEGRKWQESAAALMAAKKRIAVPFGHDVSLDIEFITGNKRRWDVDNRIKAVQDCLSMAGVIADDTQVVDLHARRMFGYDDKTYVTVTSVMPPYAREPLRKLRESKKVDGLKQCRFCGDSGTLFQGRNGKFYVQCLTCGNVTDEHEDVNDALEQWNEGAMFDESI